jgi:PadR family transcriptional regulator, regulatory protein PadR
LFYRIEHMRRRLGDLELATLVAVARLDRDAHGLAIRSEVSDRARHDYSVGAIYTTLERLEQKGLLKSWMTEPLPIRGGRSRRQFELTTAGRESIREAQNLAVSFLASVTDMPPRLA